MSIFLIIFMIAFLFCAIKRMEWAIWIVLFLLPIYQLRFSVLGIPSTMLEVMILIVFGSWFIKNKQNILDNLKIKIKILFKNYKIKNYKITTRYPFDIEIVLFLIVSFIAVGVAGWSNSAFGIFKAYVFEPLLLYILLFNTVFQKKDFSKILWPLTLSAFVVSLVAVLQKFGLLFSPENFLPRVTGVFTYPNALGLYLGPIIFLLIGLLISNLVPRTRDRIFKLTFIILTLIFSFASLFFASSEGAVVGVFAALLVFILVLLSEKIKFFKFLSKAVVGIVFLFILLSPLFFLKVVPEYSYPDFGNQTVNKIYDKLTLKDFSGEVRKQQWRETFAMMQDDGRWFWGVGLSGYQEAVRPYHQAGIFFNFERDPDFRRKLVLFDEGYKAKHWQPVEIYMYPHNIFLNFWVELGLLGVILFVWLFGKILYFLIQSSQDPRPNTKYISLSLLGVFTILMVHGIVDVPYFKNDLAVLFWIFIGMVGVLKINRDIKEKK